MTKIAKITLLFVVFVDLIGQGLVFPIINSLIMETKSGFLPENTPEGRRHFYYGLVIGCFFLSWFLGVVYVSKGLGFHRAQERSAGLSGRCSGRVCHHHCRALSSTAFFC